MTSYDNVTVTTATASTKPLLWMRVETHRQGISTVRETITGDVIIGRTGPRTQGRTSTLMFLYDSETASATAETLLASGEIFRVLAPDRLTHQMKFVVIGDVARTLDEGSRSVWIVTAEVKEIP